MLIPFYFINFLLGYFEYYKNKNKIGLFLLPSILLGIGLVFFTKLSFPESRTWLFLPSIFFIVADNGFSLLITKLKIKFQFLLFLLVFSLLTVPLRSYTSANNPFNLEGDNGFPESNIVIKMIEKFRVENNFKNLNLYTNNSNAMSYMQIWENNYP